MLRHVKDYRNHVGSDAAKFYKTTLFQSERLLLGLNCLDKDQEQGVHDHTDQDKFYLVLEGRGKFSVAGEQVDAGPGEIVWAPAGVAHGVSNPDDAQLVLLVGIAPSP